MRTCPGRSSLPTCSNFRVAHVQDDEVGIGTSQEPAATYVPVRASEEVERDSSTDSEGLLEALFEARGEAGDVDASTDVEVGAADPGVNFEDVDRASKFQAADDKAIDNEVVASIEEDAKAHHGVSDEKMTGGGGGGGGGGGQTTGDAVNI